MKLCDYKYIMGIELDADCKDISDIYIHSPYRTIIDGTEYNLSERAYEDYLSYKNTPEQALVWLESTTNIPFVVLKDAYINEYDSFWQELYKKSLFEDGVNEALVELYSYDNEKLDSLIELYTISGKTLEIGSKINDEDLRMIYRNDGIYSIWEQDNNLICNKYEINNTNLSQKIIYVGNRNEEMFDAVICDIAKKWFDGNTIVPKLYKYVAEELGVSGLVADKMNKSIVKEGVAI